MPSNEDQSQQADDCARLKEFEQRRRARGAVGQVQQWDCDLQEVASPKKDSDTVAEADSNDGNCFRPEWTPAISAGGDQPQFEEDRYEQKIMLQREAQRCPDADACRQDGARRPGRG